MSLGCSKNNDSNATDVGVPFDQLGSAPRVDVPKENFPEWLVVRINDYYESRPPSFCKIQIFRGKLNAQSVYFIVDTYIHLSTVFLCEFFTETGERIVNTSDCRAASKNWILIYEYGEFALETV